MTKAQQAEKQEYIEKLRELLKPGDTLHTVLRSVSSSGMSRNIDVYLIRDGEPQWLSSWICKATGMSFNKKRGCIRIGGCGMDMGFNIVYELSYRLFPDGFECIGEGCPSNDHYNGDRNYTPHHHESGGYAIKQKWM
jgi:hypothetical protein